MTQETQFVTACFVSLPDAQGKPSSKGKTIPVHFNPNSLQYDVSNTLKNTGQGNKKKQYVSESTAKLTMELFFDTTLTGVDVRQHTQELAQLMNPAKGEKGKAPPVVEFQWGSYRFRGMVESYKETINFFAPVGVPLRSKVNLTMSQQDKVFEAQDTGSEFDTQQGNNANRPAVEAPTASDQAGPGPGNGSAADVASAGGDPRAARAIAADNGQESLRFGTGDALVVAADVELGGPVAFASGGASLGAGAGIGISAGAGIGVGAGASAGISIGGGISAGASAGISAGAGVSASGGFKVSASAGASAGVSAVAGAFGGLKATASVRHSSTFDPERLLPIKATASLSTDGGATFSLGGQATLESSTSLRADVGASASLKAKLEFDE